MSTILKSYIGIDPGNSGGLAQLIPERQIVRACVMPIEVSGSTAKGGEKHEVDPVAVWKWFNEGYMLKPGEVMTTVIAIEKVSAMPKQGVVSMFNFGVSYGSLLSLLKLVCARAAPGAMGYIRVTPQAWKKQVLMGTGHEKADAIAYVRAKYPNLSLLPTERCTKPHDGMADAVCLAEYAAMSKGYE